MCTCVHVCVVTKACHVGKGQVKSCALTYGSVIVCCVTLHKREQTDYRAKYL